MVKRYLKAQLTVLLCGGLVGPIFLAVFFALGTMARPYLNWMFWTGLFVTAGGVLVALALTNYSAKSAARHDEWTRTGVSGPDRTVSERLQELQTLHATGAITEAEYNAKRRDILADL